MATTPVTTRQSPLVAIADLRIANIGSGNGITVALPANALMTNIGGTIYTAFDSGSGTTFSASDGTTTFISAEDAKAAAHSALAVDIRSKFFPNGGTITFSLAETGATATVGRLVAFVEYVVLNRTTEIQG